MPLRKGPQHWIATAGVALAVVAAPAPAAQAASCPVQPTTKAFAAWGDKADYSLLSGGGFEPGTSGWQLNTSSAKLVADQDSYNVSGKGSRALELGAPSSAASPAFCVDTTNPHFKFMVKTVKAATLTTIIQYQRADGSWANALSAQVKRAASGWQPTDPNPLSTSVPGLVAGRTANVRLWWINTGGTSRIDSVMVDPYRTR